MTTTTTTTPRSAARRLLSITAAATIAAVGLVAPSAPAHALPPSNPTPGGFPVPSCTATPTKIADETYSEPIGTADQFKLNLKVFKDGDRKCAIATRSHVGDVGLTVRLEYSAAKNIGVSFVSTTDTAAVQLNGADNWCVSAHAFLTEDGTHPIDPIRDRVDIEHVPPGCIFSAPAGKPGPKPGDGAPHTGGEGGEVPVGLVWGGALLGGAALVVAEAERRRRAATHR